MTTRKTLKIFAITAAALSCAISPAAFAASSNDVSIQIDTRYLEADWGVNKVYDTLSNKAERACDSGGSRDLSSLIYEKDCMSDLLDDFIKSADIDTLTNYHVIMTK